jgi:hypothetical protein
MPFKQVPPLYTVWQGMRRRCLNPNFKQWKDYGGRGITICREWDSYDQFVSDMGPRPTPKHTLERKNNDLGYSKENCKWATRKEQQHNQTVTRKVTIEGVEYIAVELAEKYGIKTDTIVERATEGLSFDAVTKKGHLRWNTGRVKDNCKNGHAYTAENTRVLPSGQRVCRECARKNSQMRYWAARARGVSASDL